MSPNTCLGSFFVFVALFMVFIWGMGPYDSDPDLWRSIGVIPDGLDQMFSQTRFARIWNAIRGKN